MNVTETLQRRHWKDTEEHEECFEQKATKVAKELDAAIVSLQPSAALPEALAAEEHSDNNPFIRITARFRTKR
jgi:hypothetical protein